MSKGGRQKGGHTPKISEHKDNDDDTNKNPAGGQQADDTPGVSQQSVHDPGKREIEELKRRMVGQEDKVRKMAEDLEGLENEIANHKEAVETERQQREKLETELEEEGKMREDVTDQIKEQTKDYFGKMEQRLKVFEEQAKKIEDLVKLQQRIEKLEEKMKNTYIGGFFILVLAIMLGVVFTMYCGQSDPPGPSPPRPIPIPDYEKKIQALESRFNVLESNVDTKISNFQQNEMASMSSELSSLKEEYGTLKELTDGNEEFKKNHNEALDGLKTQLEDSLEKTETKLKENQEVFEQNMQKKMEDEVAGKSENLTSHIVTVVLEHEEFVKVVNASMILKENVNALNETCVEEKNEFINKQEKFDERLKETKVTLSASIDSAREECVLEIQKTGQSLTNSVAKFEVEIGSVGNLVKSVNKTVFERMESVNGEVENLHVTMTGKFTSYDTQMESFQQTLKTSSKETEGKLENVQKEFDHWKKKVVTSEGKINFLDEKGQDTNTMIILVVIIIVFIVVLVVMLMLRQRNTATPGPINISPGLRGGYEPSAILKNVKENCVKDNTVCVLHFNKESKDFCVNLTKVVESDSHKRKPYFLDNHNDILTIPRSKVIIVYVEKNQRNIILEDPDQELGDLRRTTVEAALKMGATVVVVYMHHEESRYLGNNELYCPKLQSVTRHYVLSKLEKQDGVYSVFDSYSDFQRQHLKKLISDSFIKK